MKLFVRNKNGLQTVEVHGQREVSYYPIDMRRLEICEYLSTAYEEVQTGNMVLCAWTNPDVPAKPTPVTKCELFSLSYLTLLFYLKLRTTREMWGLLPSLPQKLTSYLRERAFFYRMHVPYKVAILTCLHHGYTHTHEREVRRVFTDCGLHGDNAVFYYLFLDGEEYRDLELHEPLLLNIKALDRECERFAENPQTIRLCHNHTYRKLAFIAKSNSISIDGLSTELLMNTIASYRLCRPMLSEEYSQNYARRSMTNTVQRIIYSYTHHPDKINMWKTDSGFSLRYSTLDDYTSNFDPTDDTIRGSILFSENDMIEYLDRKKYENLVTENQTA